VSSLSPDEVADRFEIRDLIARYMRAIRVKDLDLMDDVFSDDAVIDYTAIGGERASWADTKPWLGGMVLGVDLFWLYIGDMLFTFSADRSSAEVETTWHGVFVADAAAAPLIIFGSYDDRFVRTAGRWRLAERVDRPALQVPASPPG
jgi:hypothetical protein